MRVIGVIPARYGSTRFKGKPLKLIAGKPLLQHVIEGAKQSKYISEIMVATDDKRILEFAGTCGVRAVMTESSLPSGSDRVWAAVKRETADVIVNIQGDEPLITGEELDTLVNGMRGGAEMATLARQFNSLVEIQSHNTAKIIVNHKNEAIYFSRLPVPFSRISISDFKSFSLVCLKHIGLYAYTKAFLEKFCEQEPVPLELAEGLEQLRAIWLGAQVKVILTDYESWGVDTPEDVIRVEEIIHSKRSRL